MVGKQIACRVACESTELDGGCWLYMLLLAECVSREAKPRSNVRQGSSDGRID